MLPNLSRYTHPLRSLLKSDALFKFFSTYGVYEEHISDPGSDLTSDVVRQLTEWYCIRHVFSLVGVEGTNKSTLRHLRALIADERVKDHWSDPTIIGLVQYILNSQVSHETGVVPFHAYFGTEDSTYLQLPEATSPSQTTQEFVRLLDNNLRNLCEVSHYYGVLYPLARTCSTLSLMRPTAVPFLPYFHLYSV